MVLFIFFIASKSLSSLFPILGRRQPPLFGVDFDPRFRAESNERF